MVEGVSAKDGEGLGQDEVRVDAQTETTIRGALRYLASKQLPNGSWGQEAQEKRYPVAITGYALMAFISAGQLPTEGEHAKTVAAGMEYLLDALGADGTYQPGGTYRSGQYMYEHGIATIVLAELYGQTRTAQIRPKLERAIKVIVGSQNQQGGWRYHPFARDADISVTVLQVVALRCAKNGGLDVPQETIDRAVKYVKTCHHAPSGGFGYMPGQGAGFARTAAAIYSLQVCGLYDDPLVQSGSEYLTKNTIERGWFTYGHFYAAPAQYMIGGSTWRAWYTAIKNKLLQHVRAGSNQCFWDTTLDHQAVGPVYATAVYTTILAMPYHYVPLYQR